MPTPYDIPPSMLINRLGKYLKEESDTITPPEWSHFIKTGIHNERPPKSADWWFVRCAAVLRKIYVKGPIGIEKLRGEYGGRTDKGVKPEHARKGSGAIVRNALKQLQEAGFVKIIRFEGRVVTNEGRRLLDRLSTQIKKELEKDIPELSKY